VRRSPGSGLGNEVGCSSLLEELMAAGSCGRLQTCSAASTLLVQVLTHATMSRHACVGGRLAARECGLLISGCWNKR
jgi:hypothetical protein